MYFLLISAVNRNVYIKELQDYNIQIQQQNFNTF